MSKSRSAKDLYFSFLTKIGDKSHMCHLCKKVFAFDIKVSYTNAKTHLNNSHPEYETLLQEKEASGSVSNETLDRFMLNNVS